PSDPTCGTRANPCVFNGTKNVSSGFNPNAAGADFFVRLDDSLLKGGKSTVVNYLCEIHPGMAGSVTLVSDKREASELEDVREQARDQFDRDTEEALRVDRRDNRASVKLNPDGSSHTITAIAGTATQFVEIAEMLPSPLTIKKGDSVDFLTKTIKDPHTVTFPDGSGSAGVDPLGPVCEGPTDTPVAELNPFLCGNPGLFEVHFFPQPQGATSILSPTTVGTSGIIANNPGAVNHFTFSFPNAGTFEYQCRIHDHMTGTIVVRS
ncbi:MAG TPA: hypothetical protein VKT80_04730, partial [Chloroflexota bacterium]|nr:hypothetical protein [Chloroflexota bacterium]